ncbi:hypothetical protein FRC06_000174 [Ceratobasidium sp. 370]|nr:hypothetical protein FRC06_000174 [Ceratobasidium sp. 370]
MSPTNRDKALQQFESDENIRVLLISNVGTTGLNLTMASVVIFLSGLWSGMEIKQTIGRLWRAGQIEIVIVHHIFAPGTADVLLASLAGDKVMMLDHLYEAGSIAQKVFNTPKCRDYVETEAQAEGVPADGATRSKAPVRSQKRIAEADSSSGSNEMRPSKRGKISPVISDALSTHTQLPQSPSDVPNPQPESKPSDGKAPAVDAVLLPPAIVAAHGTIVSPAHLNNHNCHALVPRQTPPSACFQLASTSHASSSDRASSPGRPTSPVTRALSSVRGPSPILLVQSPVSSPPPPSSPSPSPPPAPPPRDRLAHAVEQSIEPNAGSFAPTTGRATRAIEQPHIPSVSRNPSASSTKSPTLPVALVRPKASARVTTASTVVTTPRQLHTVSNDHTGTTRLASREVSSANSRTAASSNFLGRPLLHPPAPSSSQGRPRDHRLADLPTQFPGQFRLKAPVQPATAPKPPTTGKRVLRSPPRTARPGVGAVVRPSTSPPPDAKGKPRHG